ncbi:MAG: hypothetical protein D6704_12405 [Nitrospirae bacterium]|nr:MAG: hypothetical protein D6704_12405 [Nitrospirota bacterium]
MGKIILKGFAGLKDAMKAVEAAQCLTLIREGRHVAAYDILKSVQDYSSYAPEEKRKIADVFYQVAKLFQHEENFDKAEKCLVEAINLDKNHPFATLRLDVLKKARKRLLSEYEKARQVVKGQPLSLDMFRKAQNKIFRDTIKITCYKECDNPKGESPLHCAECKGFIKSPKTKVEVKIGVDDCFMLGIYRWKGDTRASENYSCMVRKFKHGDYELAQAVSRLFADSISKRTNFLKSIDIITAVPGDPIRTRDRGYNPPSVLAEGLADRFGVPFIEGLLRKKESLRAKDLSAADISKIYQDAGKKSCDLKGRVVLLVDDVATRGTTLSTCAQILKKLGAEKVYTAVLAKAETTSRRERKIMSDLDKLAQWHQLSMSKFLGPIRFKALFDRFGPEVHRVFDLSDEELLSIKGITKQAVAGIREQAGKYEESYEFMKKQLALADQCGGGILTLDSPDYPIFLRKSATSHAIIYYRGEIGKFKDYKKAVAIVGSREATEESKVIAEETAKELARRGWVITSGLANGIDAAAHKGALAAKGLTIAFLGCGPDVIYPAGSDNLNAEIADKGLILSEFPFGTKVEDWRLKKRNKTIVGAALGAFVVQTSKSGGAMNAVRGCREQKKPIFTLEPPAGDEMFSGNAEILLEFKGVSVSRENCVKVIADRLSSNDELFPV